MATPWQVLDLTGFDGHIGVTRGALKVGDATVPVADLGSILLGDKCRRGYGLVEKAARYGIPVVICDWKHAPIAYLNGWPETSRVAARQNAQASLTEPRRKQAWKSIVQHKVMNQATVLRDIGHPAHLQLTRISREVRSGDLSNSEAQAASIYWRALFDDSFRRDPSFDDSVNSALNYGYTILRGAVIREICAAGLWPTIGVFHRNRSNAYALADDLIEPFRPVVDAYVRQQAEQLFEIDRELRKGLVGLLGTKFVADGSTVNTAIRTVAQNFAQYVEGDQEKLVVPVWHLRRKGG